MCVQQSGRQQFKQKGQDVCSAYFHVQGCTGGREMLFLTAFFVAVQENKKS